jgi:uncharacterized protein DUF892
MAEKKLADLFYDTLKDIYFAERQILKSLPKMAKAAQSDELKQAFLTHHDETEGQVDRLQQVFEIFGKRAQAKTCEAIMGILEEGKEIIEEYKDSQDELCAGSLPLPVVSGGGNFVLPARKCALRKRRHDPHFKSRLCRMGHSPGSRVGRRAVDVRRSA